MSASFSLKQRFDLSRFTLGEAPSTKPITLTHRRIFILPTGRGLVFAALVVLLLLIAFVYNNNLAYLLSFLLGSVFFISILHTFKSMAGLVVQHGHSTPAFAGEAAGFALHIHNPGHQPRFNLQIIAQTEQSLCLVADEKKVVMLYLPTAKRGWQPLGTVTLACSYPLGLFRAWSPLRFDVKALVYPKPAAFSLPFPETEGGQGTQGQNRKNGDDFYGIRAYQNSDPIRQIHWKAFAKGQGLMSKQYGGESSVELWLDYDAAPGHHTEERLSAMCRWVIDAERAGLRYGLKLPGVAALQPEIGLAHYQRCLEALALF